MTFGEFVRERRTGAGLSVSELAQRIGWDASNWSKVERGELNGPANDRMLGRIADALGLRGEEWGTLCDLAALSRKRVPSELLAHPELLELVPLLSRVARQHRA